MSARQHLLIDGANLLYAWPELRTLQKRDRDAARAKLTQMVSGLHDTGDLRVTLVFDGRGSALTVEPVGGAATFTQIYTPAGMTADDVIEQLVAQAADPALCVVATADRAQRNLIESLGATGISPEELAGWAARTSSRQTSQLAGLRREADRKWRRR